VLYDPAQDGERLLGGGWITGAALSTGGGASPQAERVA